MSTNQTICVAPADSLPPDLLRQMMEVPYLEGGRGVEGWDCFGKVRAIRMAMKKLPSLPLLAGLTLNDIVAAMQADAEIRRLVGFAEVPANTAQPGDVLCCYSEQVLTHIAIAIRADGMLKIAHTGDGKGGRLTKLPAFLHHYGQVRCYRG